MWILISLIVLIIGFVAGFVFALCCQLKIEEIAVKQGMVRLTGRYYKITKLDK